MLYNSGLGIAVTCLQPASLLQRSLCPRILTAHGNAIPVSSSCRWWKNSRDCIAVQWANESSLVFGLFTARLVLHDQDTIRGSSCDALKFMFTSM